LAKITLPWFFLERLVLEISIQRRRRRHPDVKQQQRVAVGLGLRHLGDPERAAGTADVLDHEGRTRHRLAHRLGKVARDRIGRAAGRERHHDRDRVLGPRGVRGSRDQRQSGRDG
jgi:hypothetical protein